MMTKEQD